MVWVPFKTGTIDRLLTIGSTARFGTARTKIANKVWGPGSFLFIYYQLSGSSYT